MIQLNQTAKQSFRQRSILCVFASCSDQFKEQNGDKRHLPGQLPGMMRMLSMAMSPWKPLPMVAIKRSCEQTTKNILATDYLRTEPTSQMPRALNSQTLMVYIHVHTKGYRNSHALNGKVANVYINMNMNN